MAGVGGIGKTTIAREFAEQLIRSSPFGFERLIWFSAKKRYYTASIGKYTPTLRVDFSDTRSLLRSLLLELGCAITPDAATIIAGEESGRMHFLRLEGMQKTEGRM